MESLIKVVPKPSEGRYAAHLWHDTLLAMCGRFTQHYSWREIQELYGLVGAARNLQPHYNIAPTETIEVVRRDSEGPALSPMRWGLIPYWWKKAVKDLPATFNARAETIADRPMFRDSFAKRRCIIPASGYYEWTTTPDGKQPYLISAADGGVLSVAGLWDRWKNAATGETVVSCTMVITTANEFTRKIHDRMPVLLDRGDIDAWLGGSAGSELLKSVANDRLRAWPVSRRVNKTGSGDEDPAIIEKIAV